MGAVKGILFTIAINEGKIIDRADLKVDTLKYITLREARRQFKPFLSNEQTVIK